MNIVMDVEEKFKGKGLNVLTVVIRSQRKNLAGIANERNHSLFVD